MLILNLVTYLDLEAESRKHMANDGSVSEGLGWVCVPIAVETHGNWGRDILPYDILAWFIATQVQSYCRPVSRLNLTHMRAIARASQYI